MVDTLPTRRTNPFDPPPMLAEYRSDRPLRRLAFPDGHVGWLVTSHELAREVLVDLRFSSRLELLRYPVRRPEPEGFAMGQPPRPGFFLFTDPPDHTRFRRLLTGHFTVRRMKLLEPRIQRIVDDHLDAMERTGPPAELMEAFALPVPSLAICELLGVPYAERGDFQRNSILPFSLGTTDQEASDALSELAAYFADLIRRRRRDPEDDLVSGLAAAGGLSDEELAGAVMFLLFGGLETTANMLALGTFALLVHQDQADAVRGGAASVESAVEELLRYLSIAQFGLQRTALENVRLHSELIQAGETVVVSLPAANRDPVRFTEPDRLDLARDETGHLAFGHGVHQCIGQQLARVEMRVGYAGLLRRFPNLRLAVPAEEIPLRSDMVTYGVHQLPVEW